MKIQFLHPVPPTFAGRCVNHVLMALALVAVSTLLFATGGLAQTQPKRIGVMLFDGVLTSDVVAPLEVFGVAIENEIIDGYEIVTIAPEAGPITTHEGVTLKADFGIEDAPDLDVIIVGSRYDMDPVLEDQNFMGFVTEQASQADWIASNCSGACVLAATGLLNGVNVTVVVDNNGVTSNGSLVSYAAAIELLKNIAGPEKSKETADTIYFTRLLERHGLSNS